MLKKFQLANGLKVIFVESHKSPVVSVQMWVNTGSADEKKGEEGISHFIEHLVFKGTKKYKVGEIASVVEGSGGELNAYTSFDNTVFYVTISKEFEDVAIDVIREMMGAPNFDQTEIDNEREVVIEEIKRSNDSPGRQSSRLLFENAFQKHPYGIPVIGYDKIIKKVSRKTLVSYYQSRYVPTNMTLVVVGDFDSAAMKKKIHSEFSSMQKFKLRKVVRKKELKQSKARVAVQKASFEETYLTLSFSIPSVKHKDVPVLDILSMVMGAGDTSRLVSKLRNEKGLVNAVGCSSFTPKDPGLFVYTAVLTHDKLQESLRDLCVEMVKVLSEAPTYEEIRRAIVAFEAEEYFSLETVDGIASKVGSYETLTGDPKYFDKYIKQINAIKPVDLVKAARKYCAPERICISLMDKNAGKNEKKLIQDFIKEYTKQFKLAKNKKVKLPKTVKKVAFPKMQAAKGAKSEAEKVQLPSGATLIMLENHDSNTVSVQAAFMGGTRAEQVEKSGVANLLSCVWATGTQKYTEQEIYAEIENRAARIAPVAGRNTVGLRMNALRPFASELSDLYLDILLRPQFSELAFVREKTMQLDAIAHRKDSPAQYASIMFAEQFFGKHPYGRALDGNEESVRALNLSDVNEYFNQICTAQNLCFSIVGNFNKKEWIKKLTDATHEMQRGSRFNRQFDVILPAPSREFEHLEKEQSHVLVGYPGLTFTSVDKYALTVLQAVLGGMGGRLFVELRDKESLAYTVSPIEMEGIDMGYFGAYIGCSPEKTAKAIEMMQVEFAKVMNELIPQDELERAKRYLIGRQHIDFQRNSSIAGTMLYDHMYGLDFKDGFRFAEKIHGVTAEAIRVVARKIFAHEPVITVVGKTRPW